MIRYQLACTSGHDFEGWFQSSEAYDKQAAAHQVACPICGSQSVDKAIMAPRVAKRRDAVPPDGRELLRRIRAEVERRAEYVGTRFAEEARRIHFEEEAPRGIYGKATKSEVERLLDDGVPVLPVPALPEEQN
jgi:hypothetical protein